MYIREMMQKIKTYTAQKFANGVKTRAILIVDIKMKFKAKSARKSTVEHFSKRGIGWHGCALIYYLYQRKQDGNGNIDYNEQ